MSTLVYGGVFLRRQCSCGLIFQGDAGGRISCFSLFAIYEPCCYYTGPLGFEPVVQSLPEPSRSGFTKNELREAFHETRLTGHGDKRFMGLVVHLHRA